MKEAINRQSRGGGCLWGKLGAVFFGLLGVVILICCPSPTVLLHRLNALEFLPPLWLLGILFIGWYALVGFAAGGIRSGGRTGGHAEELWRGYTCLLAGLTLMTSWYVLCFAGEAVLLSWFLLMPSAVFLCLTALSWRRISPGICLVLMAGGLWPAVLSLGQFLVVMRS